MFYYLRTVTLVAIAVLACAATINYKVDPAHLFDKTSAYERGVAKLLLDGWNVADIVNYDERIAQEFYITGLTDAPDTIVFGSSRSMQVRATAFPGKTFFNHAVSGGSLEDYMAIYEIYHQKGLTPKSVVIGVDPWILNANNDQNRWRSLKSYLENISDRLSLQIPFQDNSKLPASTNQYMQLISFAYLEQSFKQLWNIARRGGRTYFATHDSHLTNNVKLADGSLVYGASVRNRTTDEVRIRAIGNAKRGVIYSLGGFKQLDSRAMLALDAWIQSMRKDGVEVILFLPPYHPASYEIMHSNPSYIRVDDASTYFKQLAKDRATHIVGDYDGSKVGCSENEFTDDMHPVEQCVTRIFHAAIL